MIALITVFTRVAATIVCLIKDPLASLRAIPRNWSRAVVSIDLFHPFEILPGALYLLESDDTGSPSFREEVFDQCDDYQRCEKALQWLNHLRVRKHLDVLGGSNNPLAIQS
jgi:hypothetical protein